MTNCEDCNSTENLEDSLSDFGDTTKCKSCWKKTYNAVKSAEEERERINKLRDKYNKDIIRLINQEIFSPCRDKNSETNAKYLSTKLLKLVINFLKKEGEHAKYLGTECDDVALFELEKEINL
jgi:hypothetical protein